MNNLISKTIGECLNERAKTTPNLCGLSYRDYSYSWREVDEISDFIALDFLKLGIKKGSHVAIWSVNNPNWVLSYFALVKIGAVAILVNTCYKEAELVQILEYADVEFILCGRSCKNTNYDEILKNINTSRLPKLKKILYLEKNQEIKWYMRGDYPLYMNDEEKEILLKAKGNVSIDDTASIMFTSGTTKMPKGVKLSHYSLINNSLELTRQMKWTSEDKMCIAVPLFHCFGITAGILSGVHSGACLHLLKYYKTLEVLEQIEKYKCTVLNGVPTMFMALVRNTKLRNYDLSYIKSGIVAGSAIHPEEYINICQCLKIRHLQTSYGQTETSPCISISDYEDSMVVKANTAGKCIDNVELKIWNKEQNREALENEIGEILTRGYHVMQGYYNMQEETKSTIDTEGWLHTGDLGFLDFNGYLHVTGRIKEMIIRGGENISPLEIEHWIRKLNCVEQVKVIGVQAEVLQEEIAACIIPKQGMNLDEDEVKSFVAENLADYKVPKYILIFDEFPLTSSGKIQLGELRRQIEKRIK